MLRRQPWPSPRQPGPYQGSVIEAASGSILGERYDRVRHLSSEENHTERRRGDRADIAPRRDRAGQAQASGQSRRLRSLSACEPASRSPGSSRRILPCQIGSDRQRTAPAGCRNSPAGINEESSMVRDPSPPHIAGPLSFRRRDRHRRGREEGSFHERHLLMRRSCRVAAGAMAPSLLPRRSAAIRRLRCRRGVGPSAQRRA